MSEPLAACSFQALGPDSRCLGVGGMMDQRAPPSISHRVESLESTAYRSLLPLLALRGRAAFISPRDRFPRTFFRRSACSRLHIFWLCPQIRYGRSITPDQRVWRRVSVVLLFGSRVCGCFLLSGVVPGRRVDSCCCRGIFDSGSGD